MSHILSFHSSLSPILLPLSSSILLLLPPYFQPHIFRQFGDTCWKFKKIFIDVRERASKAIEFAKMLRKVQEGRREGGEGGEGGAKKAYGMKIISTFSQDLEIAADFSIKVNDAELLSALKASGHTLVLLPNHRENLIFVPQHMADHEK